MSISVVVPVEPSDRFEPGLKEHLSGTRTLTVDNRPTPRGCRTNEQLSNRRKDVLIPEPGYEPALERCLHLIWLREGIQQISRRKSNLHSAEKSQLLRDI